LGVASVGGVAGEGGVVAEIFFFAAAEWAGAVRAADPGDAYACAFVGVFDDFTYDLVAEDEGFLHDGDVAFVDVQVGAAYSAGEDAKESVAGGDLGARDVFHAEGLVGSVEDGSFHGGSSVNGFGGWMIIQRGKD
jgi:hypothetical protein